MKKQKGFRSFFSFASQRSIEGQLFWVPLLSLILAHGSAWAKEQDPDKPRTNFVDCKQLDTSNIVCRNYDDNLDELFRCTSIKNNIAHGCINLGLVTIAKTDPPSAKPPAEVISLLKEKGLSFNDSTLEKVNQLVSSQDAIDLKLLKELEKQKQPFRCPDLGQKLLGEGSEDGGLAISELSIKSGRVKLKMLRKIAGGILVRNGGSVSRKPYFEFESETSLSDFEKCEITALNSIIQPLRNFCREDSFEVINNLPGGLTPELPSEQERLKLNASRRVIYQKIRDEASKASLVADLPGIRSGGFLVPGYGAINQRDREKRAKFCSSISSSEISGGGTASNELFVSAVNQACSIVCMDASRVLVDDPTAPPERQIKTTIPYSPKACGVSNGSIMVSCEPTT